MFSQKPAVNVEVFGEDDLTGKNNDTQKKSTVREPSPRPERKQRIPSGKKDEEKVTLQKEETSSEKRDFTMYVRTVPETIAKFREIARREGVSQSVLMTEILEFAIANYEDRCGKVTPSEETRTRTETRKKIF